MTSNLFVFMSGPSLFTRISTYCAFPPVSDRKSPNFHRKTERVKKRLVRGEEEKRRHHQRRAGTTLTTQRREGGRRRRICDLFFPLDPHLHLGCMSALRSAYSDSGRRRLVRPEKEKKSPLCKSAILFLSFWLFSRSPNLLANQATSHFRRKKRGGEREGGYFFPFPSKQAYAPPGASPLLFAIYDSV